VPDDPRSLDWILAEVQRLRLHVDEFLASKQQEIESVHPAYRRSAENLLAYTALRQLDLRKLQLALAHRGLSSLGRSEAHVLNNLEELQRRLEACVGQGSTGQESALLNWSDAEKLLHEHTRALLGERPRPRHVHIMVTAPDEAPGEAWCASLANAGMSVLRINTAHGDPGSWRETAEQCRRAARPQERSIRLLVDLEGPKLRVAPLRPGPLVARYRPERDELGRVRRALRILVVGDEHPPPSHAEPPLVIPASWLAQLRVGDELSTHDTRERRRVFHVVECSEGAAVVELQRSAYLGPESELRWLRGGHELGATATQGLPRRPGQVEVAPGDELRLSLSPLEGHPGERHPTRPGEWLTRPLIGIDLSGVALVLKPGHRVLIDDGKIETVALSVADGEALVRVTRTPGHEGKIRAEKGVNFPDSEMIAGALSEQDRRVLPGVLDFAEIIGLSFVQTPDDLREALETLRGEARGRTVGALVKLETARALQNLPELLLTAMQHFPAGIMIARGDLAVEVGFERLAEMQQEILWFCEAAHLPVVWATQVLDTLARTGIPSRAEITDASVSVQAECVMLNKGPYIAEACRTLDVILRKMEQHQYKRRNLYRPLQISMLTSQSPGGIERDGYPSRDSNPGSRKSLRCPGPLDDRG
jgi:pyruvate kinase